MLLFKVVQVPASLIGSTGGARVLQSAMSLPIVSQRSWRNAFSVPNGWGNQLGWEALHVKCHAQWN